ncbi:LysR family transcriptional regulator [Mongoliimonas terrestris]|uniref:LysR family transcriptional regulator n=1 Tax=Mongoliimonas terrestris TaxID=1709001 RepID=UPI000949A2BB|nr:LysR family transcriptional regulator [Mongoliimonas terrestris]
MTVEPGWDLYRTFLSVVEEGSLSGAARALGVTQPTVSRHIDALEAFLGYDLFLRTQRGLLPTEAANDLRPHAERLAAAAAALVRAASGHGTAVHGTVRVSASDVVGVEILPPILADLRLRHPDLTVELVLTDAVEDLLRRDADVAVRMVDPTQTALVARRVGVLPLGLHAHRRYLERRGRPESLADLAGHDLIGFDRQTAAVRAIAARLGLPEATSFALKVDSNVAQLAAVRAGVGIGICQVGVARRDPDMVRLLAEAVSLDLPVHVVMHEDLRSSPRCRAVFDALVSGLSAAVRAAA